MGLFLFGLTYTYDKSKNLKNYPCASLAMRASRLRFTVTCILLVFVPALTFNTITTPQPKAMSSTLSQNGREDNVRLLKNKIGRRSCRSQLNNSRRKRTRYGPCELDEDGDDDVDESRREAAFAIIGSLWSITTATGAMGGGFAMFHHTEAAHAAYGADAKMLIPNAFEGMSDRINKQCLVESLGNRECLLYLDPDSKLYQGADSEVLLQRLEKASAALASIPSLAEQKKWSQVLGVTTGPMGTLTDTLNQLTKLSSDKRTELAKKNAQKVKSDIIAIGQAAQRKEGKTIPDLCQAAEQHLADFVSNL